MISMSLATIILAAVFTAFIMIGRSSMRVVNYSVMESQTRRAFEQLAIDARMANAFTATITGGEITSFTLSIPSENLWASPRQVTYGYDTSNSADKKFFCIPDVAAAPTVRLNLITGLKALTILRYRPAVSPATAPVLMPVLLPPATDTSAGIKHLQISVSVARGGARSGNVMETTQVIRSTAFTLRNM